jgi:hypothetical protein
MRTYKSLYEEDERDNYLLQDRDLIVVIKKPHTAEEADKALHTKDNYGRYISTMRNSKVSDKDVDDYFGPRSPNVKNVRLKTRFEKFKEANPESTMEYSEWLTKGPVGTDMGPYPIRTKDNYDAFVNKFITKPNLLNWTVKDNTLVFPKDTNPGRNEIKSIVTTVLQNAGFGEKTFTFKTDVSEAKLKAYLKEEILKVYKK